MNKVYKKIIIYCPTDNTISHLKIIPYDDAIDERASDAIFHEIWKKVNKSREIVVGVTIGGDFFQLSPTQYGSYIKESWNSMQLIDRPRLLCCIAKYHEEHKIPFD